MSSDTKHEDAPGLDPFHFPSELVRELPNAVVPDDLASSITCIIIVVNPHEYRQTFRFLRPITYQQYQPSIFKTILNSVTVYFGMYGVHTAMFTQSAPGTNTVGAITNIVHALLSGHPHVRPRAVINVGVGFGANPHKHALGDVMVSTKVIDYSSIRLNADGTREHRGVIQEAGRNLMDRCKAAANEFTSVVVADHVVRSVDVHLGGILGGPVLLDNTVEKKELLKSYPDAIGGEMEGIGLYTATAMYDLEWIVIKSVCDYGDGHKEKSWQPYAAYTAAAYLEHILKQQHVWNGFPQFKPKEQETLPVVQPAQLFVNDSLLIWAIETLVDEFVQGPEHHITCPDNLPIRLLIERDDDMRIMLNMAKDVTMKFSKWDQYKIFLSDTYVRHIDKLLHHTMLYNRINLESFERTICCLTQYENTYPIISIFLLRMVRGTKKFQLFDLCKDLEMEQYGTDTMIQNEMKHALPDYTGDKSNYIQILNFLKEQGVEMEENWTGQGDDNDQVIKCMEYLRRRCHAARLFQYGTSYGLKVNVEKWKEDYPEVTYIANAAMKIALVAAGFKVGLGRNSKLNLKHNAAQNGQ